MAEHEISVYCHDKFLRHNPSLCELMDGGYRRPKEVEDFRSIGSRSTQVSVPDGAQLHQQQNTMSTMNQLYQIQHQRMMLQQMQHLQQEQRIMAQSNIRGNPHAALSMGQTGGGNNPTIGFSDNPNSLMGRNHGIINNASTTGLHRASQGFMPYRPTPNYLDRDFIIGALSSSSNGFGKSFTANDASGFAGSGSSQLSSSPLRKLSRGDEVSDEIKFRFGGDSTGYD